MTRNNLLRLASALLCLVASASFSQKLLIKKVSVEGSTPYTAAEIQAVALLSLGESVTQPQIQLATERLLQTGAFASVQALVEGTVADTSVVFNVKPADSSHFVTVGLENFVWFTPDELTAGLKKAVPFFNGTIPNSENQSNAVAIALQGMLEKQGITATVSRIPVQTSIGVASWVAEFRANGPAVLIRSITFHDVPRAQNPAAKAVVQSLIGTPYNEGLSPLNLQNALLAPFQDAGYEASAVSITSRTVASSTSQQAEVDVSASLDLGPLYHVSSIALPVSPLFTESQLVSVSALLPGSIDSQARLAQTVQNITESYQSRGYLQTVVHYSQKLDAAAHEAAITITAIAGPQFTVRSVTPVNLTAAQQSAFAAKWQLHPGAIYNQGYVTAYVKSHPDLQGYETNLDTIAGSKHEVDLTLTFVKGGTFNP